MRWLGCAFFLCLFGVLTPAMAGSWGYSGQKTPSEADLLPHPQDSVTYSEQWSGTVVFAPDHVLNFNLIHSNLTTKSEKGVFRVEYRTPGNTAQEEQQRCTIVAQSNPVKLLCGSAVLIPSLSEIALVAPGSKLSVTLKMTNLAKPFRPKSGRLNTPKDATDFYDFWLVVPRGKVIAKVNGVALFGYGSFDHSYTNTSFHNISRHWLRTTYHDKEISVLFAVNALADGRTTSWASIATDEANLSTADLTASLGAPLADPDKKGYFTPQSLSLDGPDGFSLSLPELRLKNKSDMLAGLNRMEAFVVRRFSDPMRYSTEGEAKILWNAGGKPTVSTRTVTVVVKQMNP